jgi:spartin
LPSEGDGGQISVGNVSEEYLRMALHPAYIDSSIVQASARASRLIVTGSNYLANKLNSGADSFTQRTKPNPEPLKFSPVAQARIRKVHNLSQSAAGLSARTAGSIGRVAQNVGESLGRRTRDSSSQAFDSNGNPTYVKTGVMNKSLIAFSTLMDGIEQSARTMLNSSSTAASTMVNHRYGTDAGNVASDITRGIRNVGLVYIDASGVSRRAVIKSVARGMVVGRMHNGQQVVVGAGDGGQVPAVTPPAKPEYVYYGGSSNANINASNGSSSSSSSSRTRLPPPPRRRRTPSPPPAYGAAGTYSLAPQGKH